MSMNFPALVLKPIDSKVPITSPEAVNAADPVVSKHAPLLMDVSSHLSVAQPVENSTISILIVAILLASIRCVAPIVRAAPALVQARSVTAALVPVDPLEVPLAQVVWMKASTLDAQLTQSPLANAISSTSVVVSGRRDADNFSHLHPDTLI